ncbi:protein MENT [Ursus maritimus]|uniref:Protein MENT n=2 Tax=Ursus TaxID=9639 RepID=A0A384CGL5_URSMA|nr:protein MENT [Ursus maritimus]
MRPSVLAPSSGGRGSQAFSLSPCGAPGGVGGGAWRARRPPPPPAPRAAVQTTRWVESGREGEKVGVPASLTGLPLSRTPAGPMVPAAGALLWALLLSLGPRAAGAQGLTSTETQRVSFRFGVPMSRHYRTTLRTGGPRRMKVTMEDEDDVGASADRLAGPAAAELLASTVATGVSKSIVSSPEEDESLEEGVVINARKNNITGESLSRSYHTARVPSSRFKANTQEPEIRMSSDVPANTWQPTGDTLHPDNTMSRWSTAGSTPNRWQQPSHTAMPPPEDLRLVLMPWGPWHCHCRSGTMSRTRAGRLQGLSGRLRVGALSQLRTEHRPCTYEKCPCNRLREECPLDSGLCSDTSCTTQTTTTSTTSTTTTTTTTPIPHISSRIRPTPFLFFGPSPSPSPALAFWRRVRIGLEDIWNSLSAVFTEMQPIERNRR